MLNPAFIKHCFFFTTTTAGFLRVLHKQVGSHEVVNLTSLKSKWRGLCLPIQTLEDILRSAGCTTPYIKWRTFLVEAATMIINKPPAVEDKSDSGTDVPATMHILIEVMSDRTDGKILRPFLFKKVVFHSITNASNNSICRYSNQFVRRGVHFASKDGL